MARERIDPHERVVSPERAAIGRPPGGAHRVGAHPRPHAELEHAREGRAAGRADDEALENADLRMRLADANETHERFAVHQAVGVEWHHEVVGSAPALAEIADVAGLVARVLGAAAIIQPRRIATGGSPPACDRRLLCRRDRRLIGVAQHKPVETPLFARRREARLHGLHAREGTRRVLVPDRHQERGVASQRRRTVARAPVRRDPMQPVAHTVQQPQADERVAHTEHAPGRGDHEGAEQEDFRDPPAARRQNGPEPHEEREIDENVQHRDEAAAPGDRRDGLQPRRHPVAIGRFHGNSFERVRWR